MFPNAVLLFTPLVTLFGESNAIALPMVNRGPYGAKGPFVHHDPHSSLFREEKIRGHDSDDVNAEVQHAWKAQSQPYGQKTTMCADGKQLPELYLLGAPKSSSTSLAFDLMNAGMMSVHDPFNDKEFHFFDGMLSWDWSDETGIEAERRRWLSWMPDCPQPQGGNALAQNRKLLADFTPDYLRLVTLPENSLQWGTFPPWNGNNAHQYNLGAQPKGGNWKVNMPPVLRKFYGEGKSHQLTLVSLLREPLARMQSAWYHAQTFNFTNECIDCRSPSFKDSLAEHMEKARQDPPVYSDWLWTGMYGAQLEQWLKSFGASRFLLIPYTYLMKGDKDGICRKLSESLEFTMDCNSDGIPLSHEWSHPHPPLDEDIPLDMRMDFVDFMSEERSRLVRLLAEASKQGAFLASYDGEVGSEESIKSWLENGW